MKQELLSKLDGIEAEMKRIGFWDPDPPDLLEKVITGEIQSYLDAPSFELWLQQIFLPNARDMIENDAVPETSEVGVMAMRQYDYHEVVPKAQGLMKLLYAFDERIGEYNRREKK